MRTVPGEEERPAGGDGNGRGAALPIRRRIATLAGSPIREIAHEGMSLDGVIPLWFGEPDRPTPDFIVAASDRALRAGHTFYSHNSGVTALRETIAGYTSRLYGREVSADRVTVTAAGMNALMAVAELLIDPGDNLVGVTPVWPNFFRCVEIMDGIVREVPLTASDDGWRLDLDRLFAACDGRTRAICINSPSNPTGWVMEADEQRAVLDFCRARGLWVIADEVYARVVYDRPAAPSFLEVAEPDDLLLVVNSFSKTWAMTGWRLGWITAPPALEPTLEKLNEFNVASPASASQYAGIAAIRDGEPFVADMMARYRTARDATRQRLAAMRRVRLAPTDGAFYAFFAVDGVTDSRAFARTMLQRTKVGLAPGIAFGRGGEERLRICFAKSPELLGEAFDRLAPHLDA